MRLIASLLAVLALSASAFAAGAAGDPATEDQKTLYALGLALGRNVTMFNLKPAELKWVEKGLEDQAKGSTPKVDLQTYGPKIEAMAKSRQEARAVSEKEKSKKFLDEMAAKPGAQKGDDGLIYIPIKEGGGKSPKPTDTVKVMYKGTFIDGKTFDESKQPITFPLNGVIKCWTEGVAKMKVGGEATLVCPSNIAYGDQGQGPIPGGATLVFNVKLLGIEAAPSGK